MTFYPKKKTILGYLNDAGKLNLGRFEIFMEEMSEVDRDLFREHYEDLKFMESKYVRYVFQNSGNLLMNVKKKNKICLKYFL